MLGLVPFIEFFCDRHTEAGIKIRPMQKSLQ
jgi:hypothetical protein